MSSTPVPTTSRGRRWFSALTIRGTSIPTHLNSVLVADAVLGMETARFLAVVPDPNNRFPRARNGEVGLEEGWTLAKFLRQVIGTDPTPSDAPRRPIVAVVDVTSQAYGRREEMLGIHLACAAAADAYASARLAGHPVIALIVGQAMSGAFLAHGYQANRILALDSPEVMVHAMGKAAAARVTRRSLVDLEKLGKTILPMAYDIRTYAELGLLHKLIDNINADEPSRADIERVRLELINAIADARRGPRDLSSRLRSPQALRTRSASVDVRRRLEQQWSAS